jgi:hypothetical protein
MNSDDEDEDMLCILDDWISPPGDNSEKIQDELPNDLQNQSNEANKDCETIDHDESDLLECTRLIEGITDKRPTTLSSELITLSDVEEKRLIEEHAKSMSHSNKMQSYLGTLTSLSTAYTSKSSTFYRFLLEKHGNAQVEPRATVNFEKSFTTNTVCKLIEENRDIIAKQLTELFKSRQTSDPSKISKPHNPRPSAPRPPREEPTMRPNDRYRISTLTADEQKEFLELNLLLHALPNNRKARYFELKETVERETADYLKYIFEDTVQTNRKNRYLHINHNAAQAVDIMMAAKQKRLATIPRYYSRTPVQTVSLKPKEVQNIKLEHVAEVCKIGQCYVIAPPLGNTNNGVRIPVTKDLYDDTLCKLLPVQEKPTSEPTPFKKRPTVEVSSDPIINSYIATKHDFDVAISASSLRTLVHNIMASTECAIPVTVVAIDEQGTKRILVDKPLIKKKYTLREKNGLYYKKAFQSMTRLTQFIDYDTQNKEVNTELFQTLYNGEGQNDEATENTQPNRFDVNDNTVYNMWNIGDLRMLVRCKNQGCTLGQKPTVASVCVRMEYMLDRALEISTATEEVDWYMQALLRPQSNVIMARVDPFYDNIVQVNHRRIESLMHPPPVVYDRLYAILQQLSRLETGRYLVTRHPHPNDDHLVILKNQEVGMPDSYDLSHEYANAGENDKTTIPYVPYWAPSSQNQIRFTFPIGKNDARNNHQNNQKKHRNRYKAGKRKPQKSKQKTVS